MISVKFLKNSARMQELINTNSFWRNAANMDTAKYARTKQKVFSEILTNNVKGILEKTPEADYVHITKK